jgi:hypothetical protein
MPIEVEDRVWVPRSNGSETIGTVKEIQRACPKIGRLSDMAYVTWSQQMPSNVAYPESHAMLINPCIRTVTMHMYKWIEVEKLRPAEVAA